MFACVYWFPTLCRIIYFYVFASVLWYPLRFQHKTIVGPFLPPVLCRRTHILYAICVYLWVVISNTSWRWVAWLVFYLLKTGAVYFSSSTCIVHPRFLGSVLIIIFLLVFVMFVFVLWLVCSKMPVFLYCPFLISPSIFLNVDSTRCERLRFS